MRLQASAVALVLAAGAALAQEGTDLAPEAAPNPQARPEASDLVPDGAREPSAEEPAGAVEEAPEDLMLFPPDATDDEDGLSFGLQDESPEATGGVREAADPPIREILAETEEELGACLSALEDLGVTYERADPIFDPDTPHCGIANPVTISEMAPGVAVEPAPTLRCEAALRGARWVSDVVVPLTERLEGRGALVAIDQGTGYMCRPRADGKLSDHAFGNALDVMAFRFQHGEPIPVQPRAGDGTIEEAFQRAVRAGACLDFTTVLGPGSDADHADHLHLDIKTRENGFRICE